MQQNLKGFVCNANDGLHFQFNSTTENAKRVLHEILDSAPIHAKIKSYYLKEIDFTCCSDFKIIESKSNTLPNILITPDYALCDDCKAEMHDPSDRRYQYPFITCTQCGPRVSITSSMPYDRSNTSMHYFEMCNECKTEYDDIHDRRYFSQTNSCNICGVELKIFNHAGEVICIGNSNCLIYIQQSLLEGKIIAVKGIGGYLLICDAANSASIKDLRSRKARPTKPFAILCNDITQINELVHCNEKQLKLLQSEIAPILLLPIKNTIDLAVDDIAPGLHSLGVMLPYAPLFEMILHRFNKPIIATSANISNAPIVFNDIEAIHKLSNIADIIVTHNREIAIPQDDSVVRFSPKFNVPIIIRRSRGMAPSQVNVNINSDQALIATGALMKSTFSLLHHTNVYTSQYLGNTEEYESQECYRLTLQHYCNVLNLTPDIIVTDKHPQYFTSTLAKELIKNNQAKAFSVQHHKAHFAAVLAENNLMESEQKILGVIWDGTGYGDDGESWGGEFFGFEDHLMERELFFEYFPVLLGDKMAREPRLSALSICTSEVAKQLLKEKFSDREWNLYNKMLQQEALILSSSCGRMFDAVASLLDLKNTQSYEGEAALMLETLAQRYFTIHGYQMNENYSVGDIHYGQISISKLFEEITADILNKKPFDFIAAKFHYSLVKIIKNIAWRMQVKKIACSGGVFQNAVLVDLLIECLSSEYELFFHKELSPNDENISFGQLMYWHHNIDDIQQREEHSNNHNIQKLKICV